MREIYFSSCAYDVTQLRLVKHANNKGPGGWQYILSAILTVTVSVQRGVDGTIHIR